MRLTVFFTLNFLALINCETYDVSTAKELTSALEVVNPGDTINLQDGEFHGKFIATRSGSEGSPITLKGSKNAIISGYNYGVWVQANYWNLEGFSVTNSNKGIVLENASHCILDGLDVGNVKQEGIHFRVNSADNILRNSNVHDTGLGSPGFGEGVYLGQAVSHWDGDTPDKSDRNQVINNYIGPNVAAEAIDIKEGSCCGTIQGNTFDGTGMSGENYADSWIDVKGDSYLIVDNTGSSSLKDGIQIHHITDAGMGGCDNTIEHNHCSDLGSDGQCVANESKGCTNTIDDNN